MSPKYLGYVPNVTPPTVYHTTPALCVFSHQTMSDRLLLHVLFFTQYKTYRVAAENSVTLPFVLNDVMGLESQEESGILPEDIISILQGHVKEGYTVENLLTTS